MRTLLILARASNLPTVWSNCLAAWWLGGGGSLWGLPVLLLGASLLYVGGMFLNDAVDASFDRQHRRERPIPSGEISQSQVWRFGAGLLGVGTALVIILGLVPLRFQSSPRNDFPWHSSISGSNETPATPGLRVDTGTESESAIKEPAVGGTKTRKTDQGVASGSAKRLPERPPDGIKSPATTIVLTLVLVAFIVLYNFVHKAVTLSPLLMGACRTLLFLDAASVGRDGLTGLAFWGALALGAYVAGLSYFARLERMLRRPQWWPCVLLAVPVGLAGVVNSGEYRRDSLLLSLILGLWIVRSLRPALGSSQQNVARAVANLLAGIVFVDLLAVCGAPKELSIVFLFLFGATLLFQKFVPAT